MKILSQKDLFFYFDENFYWHSGSSESFQEVSSIFGFLGNFLKPGKIHEIRRNSRNFGRLEVLRSDSEVPNKLIIIFIENGITSIPIYDVIKDSVVA